MHIIKVLAYTSFIFQGKELAVLMFGTRRCRHSNYLEHILNELPQYFEPSKMSFLSVDCRSPSLEKYCQENQVTKFPTLKLVYLGIYINTEYRGQRTVKDIKSFLTKLVDNDVPVMNNITELESVRSDRDHRCVIGFFPAESHELFQIFKKISGVFHEECYFYAFINDVQVNPIIAIKDTALGDDVYSGKNETFPIYQWVKDHCKPLIPELNFNNAESFVEKKRPLLILYRNNTDNDILKQFIRAVNSEIKDLLDTTVTAVHLDGHIFRNALKLANQSITNLPFVQLDTLESFHIMDEIIDIGKPGVLRTFVGESLKNTTKTESNKSIFNRLKPSTNRYSFFSSNSSGKDEL